MAKRVKFTLENNFAEISKGIEEKPNEVLITLGKSLVDEIRPLVLKRKNGGRLKRSLGYWFRPKEKDLQIGFKIFYAPFLVDHSDPITDTVRKHKDEIVQLITEAIDKLGRR